MRDETQVKASGLQIAFLIFAVVFLNAPADKYVFAQWQWAKDMGFPIGRAMIFLIAAAILFCVPALRAVCRRLLSARIQPGQRKEIAAVMVLDFIATLGVLGAFALWWWSTGGEPALARRMGAGPASAEQWNHYVSLYGATTFFILGGLLAPVIEELVFRGMLYPAWAAQWGWLAGALATSLVFGLFHSAFLPQFTGSLLLICLLRRTGSLWACIVAHAGFNILLWPPLLGRFIMAPKGSETGELSYWTPHLVCLVIAFFAIPIYMWMARDKKAVSSALPEAAPQRS